MEQPKMKNAKKNKIIIMIILIICFLPSNTFATEVYTNKTDASKAVRKALEQKKPSITFYTTFPDNNFSILKEYIFFQDENKIPIPEKKPWKNCEYLKCLYIKQLTYRKRKTKDMKYYQYTYSFTYSQTKAQDKFIEKKVNQAVKYVKKGKTKKQKVYRACTWISKNMNYKITDKIDIYTAFKYKKGQCYHYAIMYHLIAQKAGIETRLIIGNTNKSKNIETHAWCISKIGKKWYYVDPCWADKGKTINKKWILKKKNDKNFKKTHFPRGPYATETFKKRFPIAK